MRLSHERCVHLSHQVINFFEDDDRVEFLSEPNEIRQKILQILEAEMARQDELEETIRKRITTQRRDIPEGSAEYEVLFRKYYEDEMKKVRRVRE
ncbi:MAG TPA: DUF507 family protein [Candidatus Polarisedimenticolia bacterium]|jgi:hypothetical protein|nr:DUF507 family protein [Candidatus Polarisedimenticolia bacterium]